MVQVYPKPWAKSSPKSFTCVRSQSVRPTCYVTRAKQGTNILVTSMFSVCDPFETHTLLTKLLCLLMQIRYYTHVPFGYLHVFFELIRKPSMNFFERLRELRKCKTKATIASTIH